MEGKPGGDGGAVWGPQGTVPAQVRVRRRGLWARVLRQLVGAGVGANRETELVILAATVAHFQSTKITRTPLTLNWCNSTMVQHNVLRTQLLAECMGRQRSLLREPQTLSKTSGDGNRFSCRTARRSDM